MSTARLRLSKRSVIALVLALVAMFLLPSAAVGGQEDHHHSQLQRFLLISTDPSATTDFPVLAFGPIHARGVDHVVSDTKDVFEFPDGNLSVTHTPTTSHDYSDPVTCLFTHTERGTYEITGGTGAYDDASGHGHYRLSVKGIGCDQNAAPEVLVVTVNAKGPLHLS
jgi:hypothetical protein